jgi:hypothetical protein
MDSEFRSILDSSGAAGIREELMHRFQRDPAAFAREALSALRTEEASLGLKQLAHMLVQKNLLTDAISDPGECGREEATAIARNVSKMDIHVEGELELLLGRMLKSENPYSGKIVIRILDILAALSCSNMVVRREAELMAHSDAHVRSKAIRIIASIRKGRSWAVSRLSDDSRIQANAVEALWSANDENCDGIFAVASRSHNNRVAGNALIGLYRRSDVTCIAGIMAMATHADPVYRSTGAWAMGQTEDPRFLPFLADAFANAPANERHWIVRALSRIRKRQRLTAAAGKLDVTVAKTTAPTDTTRALTVSLRSSSQDDLSSLSPTQFAIFENGTLITNYRAIAATNPKVLIAAFAAPRYLAETNPYGQAIEHALTACLQQKRAFDFWSVLRYSVEPEDDPPADNGPARLPIGNFGFLDEAYLLQKLIRGPGPRSRTTPDLRSCLSKLVEASARVSGVRHLFLFIDPERGEDYQEVEALPELARLAVKGNITIHGWVPEGKSPYKPFRDLCVTTRGSFDACSPGDLASAVQTSYSSLLNRYELSYVSPNSGPAEGRLAVHCAHGAGETAFNTSPSA